MKQKVALLIVDLQNDFCPGGALSVPEGDLVVPVANRYIALFLNKGLPVFLTRDWHPEHTGHFREFGGKWPVHCVQNTPGAAFHPGLLIPKDAVILSKGMDPQKDAYSAFQAFSDDGRSFADLLREHGITSIYVGGLATDYCVKDTSIDGLAQGFTIFFLEDASRGVDITPGDSERAVAEITARGAKKVTYDDVQRTF